MELELNDGQALVLVGPRGSGKTAMAREIAKKYGDYGEVDSYVVDDIIGRCGERGAYHLPVDKAVLVVEGFPSSPRAQIWLKQVITTGKVSLRAAHGRREVARAPRLIFTTGEPHFVPYERHYRLVKVSAAMGATRVAWKP